MRENKEWVVRTCQKCSHPEPGTILIVAGDVATDVNKVVEALKMFKMRYQEVFYCVGNHELWSPGQGEMGDSIDKFVAIIDAATSVGVRCTPTVFTHPGKNELGMKQTQRILVVPMLSWYTETFKGGNRPFTQMEVHFDGACIWPPAIGDPKDKRNSHPVTLDEFWRRLGKRSIDSFLPKKFRSNSNNGSINISTNTNINTEDDEEKFRRDCGNEVAFLVTYGHFVPLPDLYNGTPFIEKVVGSEGLGEDILALRDECDCKSTPGSGRSSPAGFKKGRFDYKYEFKKATSDMISDFLEKKKVSVSNDVVKYLGDKLPMSHLQSIYNDNYKSKDSVEFEITNLYRKIKHDEDEKNTGFTLIECDNNEISILLKKHKLKDYISTFHGRKINTLEQFKLLGDGHLKDDLGIPLGDRLLINSIINKLKDEDKDKK